MAAEPVDDDTDLQERACPNYDKNDGIQHNEQIGKEKLFYRRGLQFLNMFKFGTVGSKHVQVWNRWF